MNLSLLIWTGVAVSLAWAVGAYSRLNRMREQVVRARASLLKYCKQYPILLSQWEARLGAMDSHAVQVAVVGSSASYLPWQNLKAAIIALQEPLAAWESLAVGRAHADALAAAMDAVQSCVDALASAPEDLAGALWPAEERGRWIALVADVRLRRSRYNVYATEMNEAVGQMPATVIARLAGITNRELL